VQRSIEIGDVIYRVGRQLDAERFRTAARKRYLVVEMLGVKYHRNPFCAGSHFLEKFYPLGRHFIREKRDDGEILTWPSKRHRNSRPHRTVANATDDGYAAFTCLEQRHDDMTANGEQELGLLRDKFGGQFRKPIRHTIGIAEDDFYVAAIDESGLCECVLQRLIDWSQFVAKY